MKNCLRIALLGNDRSGKTTFLTAVLNQLCPKEKFTYHFLKEAPIERIGRLTIPFQWIHVESEEYNFHFMDCMKEKDMRKFLIAIAGDLDGVVFLFSADENFQKEVIEKQLELIKLLDIRNILLFYNKMDIVSNKEQIALEKEVQEIFERSGFLYHTITCFYGSALNALQEKAEQKQIQNFLHIVKQNFICRKYDYELPFFMPIQEQFKNPENGETLFAGRVFSGSLHIGDELEVAGEQIKNRKAVCKKIEMFRRNIKEITAGDVAAVILEKIDVDTVKIGQVLAFPNTVKACIDFTAFVYVLTKKEGGIGKILENKKYIQYYSNVSLYIGEIEVLNENSKAYPSQFTYIKAKLNQAMPIKKNQSIIIEEGQKFIAIGVILDI